MAFFAFLVAFGFLAAFLVLFFAAFGIVSVGYKPRNLDRCGCGATAKRYATEYSI